MAQKKGKATKKRLKRKSPGPYPFEFRLRVVRMYLDEKYPTQVISEETGVGKSTIATWVRRCRTYGEDGLRTKRKSKQKNSKINKAVKEKIVDLKKKNPRYGSRLISDILKRFFSSKPNQLWQSDVCTFRLAGGMPI